MFSRCTLAVICRCNNGLEMLQTHHQIRNVLFQLGCVCALRQGRGVFPKDKIIQGYLKQFGELYEQVDRAALFPDSIRP